MPGEELHDETDVWKKGVASIRGVDLFCGAGGLTHGLEMAGIDVRLGMDIDPACEYPYIANNRSSFRLKPIEEITKEDLSEAFDGNSLKLLAGCAPCQPFSTYSHGWSSPSDRRWNLLEHFSRLVKQTRPHLVTMENVPRLERETVFSRFVSALEDEGFHVDCGVVNSARYGVPQHRHRLVLLASKLGPVSMIDPTTPEDRPVSVRTAIGDLPQLEAGETCNADPLHVASSLSPVNMERIRASAPGGTWRDWPERLRLACHRTVKGRTYPSVYGRMVWSAPSPTITTQFYGFGNGRFGHPEQDRALSLREGAILQSFPMDYRFVPKGEPVNRKRVGLLVGNAVPVLLGTAIGKSLVRHVERQYAHLPDSVTERSFNRKTENRFSEKPVSALQPG